MFFLAVMWNLVGVCGALAVAVDGKVNRPSDLRQAFLLLILTLAGAMLRGEPFEWIAWAPVLLASWLTYRFVRSNSERARSMRLLGRAARPT